MRWQLAAGTNPVGVVEGGRYQTKSQIDSSATEVLSNTRAPPCVPFTLRLPRCRAFFWSAGFVSQSES